MWVVIEAGIIGAQAWVARRGLVARRRIDMQLDRQVGESSVPSVKVAFKKQYIGCAHDCTCTTFLCSAMVPKPVKVVFKARQ